MGGGGGGGGSGCRWWVLVVRVVGVVVVEGCEMKGFWGIFGGNKKDWDGFWWCSVGFGGLGWFGEC